MENVLSLQLFEADTPGEVCISLNSCISNVSFTPEFE